MKNYLQFICAVFSGTMLCACDYQTLADADYMPQQIYMPAVVDGIYVVDDIAPEHGAARYDLDLEARKLRIPLGVYRAGVGNDGTVTATLVIDTDSVCRLIADADKIIVDDSGIVPQLLPDDMVMVPDAVVIADGAETGVFDMSVDLDFLMAHPSTRYVTGICLQEADRDIVGSLSYMIVEINTRFIVPSVSFTYKVTDDAEYIVEFTNSSAYGVDYYWDFGDGSEPFEGLAPGEHRYPSSGSYEVRLSARGITGDIFSYVYDLRIWENITSGYIANAGPFKRKDSGGKTGVLADWLYTDNVVGANGKGGFYLESGGVMDFYNSSKDMDNAKIYQTFTLPAGNYRAAFTPYSFRGTNECGFVVAAGDGLPDLTDLSGNPAVLGSFTWSDALEREQYGFEFDLDKEAQVTFGFVVSNTRGSRTQISNVALYR